MTFPLSRAKAEKHPCLQPNYVEKTDFRRLCYEEDVKPAAGACDGILSRSVRRRRQHHARPPGHPSGCR